MADILEVVQPCGVDKRHFSHADDAHLRFFAHLADEFVELAEEMSTDVEFVSTETEEGTQIYRAFGGIAAILSYYVDY